MAALPDFEAGAMENWGLVTYREKYLIYDEKTMTLQNKELVAIVIAHELAHQVQKMFLMRNKRLFCSGSAIS